MLLIDSGKRSTGDSKLIKDVAFMLDMIAEVVAAVDRTDNPEHGSVEYTESRPALYTKIQDQPHSLLDLF